MRSGSNWGAVGMVYAERVVLVHFVRDHPKVVPACPLNQSCYDARRQHSAGWVVRGAEVQGGCALAQPAIEKL